MRLACRPAASGDRGRRGRVPLVHAAVVDVDVGFADARPPSPWRPAEPRRTGSQPSASATSTAAYGARGARRDDERPFARRSAAWAARGRWRTSRPIAGRPTAAAAKRAVGSTARRAPPSRGGPARRTRWCRRAGRRSRPGRRRNGAGRRGPPRTARRRRAGGRRARRRGTLGGGVAGVHDLPRAGRRRRTSPRAARGARARPRRQPVASSTSARVRRSSASGQSASSAGDGDDLQRRGVRPQAFRSGQLLVLDAVRLVGVGAELLVAARLVLAEVALEPAHLAVALEGQHVGGDAVEEPAVVADHDGAAGERLERRPRARAACRRRGRWSARRAAARCRRTSAAWPGGRGCARRRRGRRPASAGRSP